MRTDIFRRSKIFTFSRVHRVSFFSFFFYDLIIFLSIVRASKVSIFYTRVRGASIMPPPSTTFFRPFFNRYVNIRSTIL